MPEVHDHPDPKQRWFHRRIMAYMSLAAALLYPLLMLVTDSGLLADIAWPFYALCGSVLGAYIGTSAWETISISRSGK